MQRLVRSVYFSLQLFGCCSRISVELKPRREARSPLQTPAREHNYPQSSPCERTQRRIRAVHGQNPVPSEPSPTTKRGADIERPLAACPSPDVKNPNVPAAASESDGVAAAATGFGHRIDRTGAATMQDAHEDVSDDGRTPECSQQSHDTIELWSE